MHQPGAVSCDGHPLAGWEWYRSLRVEPVERPGRFPPAETADEFTTRTARNPRFLRHATRHRERADRWGALSQVTRNLAKPPPRLGRGGARGAVAPSWRGAGGLA